MLLYCQMWALTGCGTTDPSFSVQSPQLLGGGDISLLGKATLAAKAAQQPIY